MAGLQNQYIDNKKENILKKINTFSIECGVLL